MQTRVTRWLSAAAVLFASATGVSACTLFEEDINGTYQATVNAAEQGVVDPETVEMLGSQSALEMNYTLVVGDGVCTLKVENELAGEHKRDCTVNKDIKVLYFPETDADSGELKYKKVGEDLEVTSTEEGANTIVMNRVTE
ncbi:hypothetical protein [Corynebacterium aquatimens]|uniref:Lipoprotein n=1 Tax=Corynebacterium aquatimens TaxID=1190508 RepID=A0A931E398_9CORY|nr:hypothetical protein [Corynebacterium aquatimens]MBG6123142.1 hypothetical protein [Corynebacterium aquatimens]WJY66527.1 hypothetical protein CAQUA_09200 [Corynebacterium aquatimens]